MRIVMAASAKGHQIGVGVVTHMTSRVDMVQFNIRGRPARLTMP